MRLNRSTTGMTTAIMLFLSVVSGCASVKSMAWNPFSDRIKDRENRYNFAQVTERSGDLAHAERNYRELCKESPKEAKYYQRLGVVLVRDGKTKDGIAMLEKARDLDEDNVAILNDLGYAYTVEGQYFEAEAALQRAMKVDSRDVRTQNNLAMVLGYMGKTDEAYDLFRRNADEGTARNNIAYIHAQSGNTNLAVKEYSKSLSHSPGNKPAAEALVQLNTLNRNLAATPKPASPVQLTANQAVESERPALQRPAQDTHEMERSDLVQLLSEVEADEAAHEPPRDPWAANPAPVTGPILPASRDDYDWSSSPR